MAMRKYNIEYSHRPGGFRNLGFTCYYNALLQALFSCTSFVEGLCLQKDSDDHLRQSLTKIASNSYVPDISIQIWRAMLQKLKSQNINISNFSSGQQCAAEGFTLLMQALNDPKLDILFFHRRCNRLFCPDCEEYFSNTYEKNNIFTIEPLAAKQLTKKMSLDRILLDQTSEVDQDCVCLRCLGKGYKILRSRLTMVPEILFILSKKYQYSAAHGGKKLHIRTEFPKKIEFPSKNGAVLTYAAVAQIEHSGELNGGHYYAICFRKGSWYLADDESVSLSDFCPTENTYIVLYHLV